MMKVLQTQQPKHLSPSRPSALSKDFYDLESLNLEDVLKDNKGRWRAELLNRRELRLGLGLDGLIAKLRSGWQWTKYDLSFYADKARAFAPQMIVQYPVQTIW